MAHDVAALAVELTDMAAADHKSAVRANSDDPAEQLAWRRLSARHGDRQLDVQRRTLQLMRQAVSAGSASPRELAFLHDGTPVNEGRKQVYGTQIAGVKDRSPVPWPCEEPERMDELRAEVGIEPFDEYVAKFSMA
ncbi:DUF6624 domain-containing protein [[Kitasatospora] papulosa]|uniref:DUF6624 domain-containing protein n=1 Tax=[Kitasatospora] papulosa TaxID=1464011 RepID=UPI0037FBCE16